MKVTFCARTLFVATLALLAASITQAAQPGGPGLFQSMRTGEGARIHSASLLSQSETTAPAPVPEAGPLDDSTFTQPLATESCEGCDSCGDFGPVGGGRFGSGLWYGSVDYLLFRPRFSNGVAQVTRVETTDQTTVPATSTLTDTAVEYPWDYQSGFRASLGYRLIDCGGDLQVTYWRMTNDASVTQGPADIFNNNPFIAGHLENNPGQDQFLTSETGVTANIFDVDFAKCISMGGPAGPCDACYCPRWDLRWSAGARIADISRFNNNVVTEANGDGVSFGDINARFVGAGPRVGILGRRYFGDRGRFSLFAKGSQALLIGDFRQSRVLTIPGEGSIIPTQVTQQFDKYSRMIPVTDIEVGGTLQVAPYTFISAGYFFQCWWDLGQGENINGTSFGPLDTSNILGFDGLFVRGEMLF